MLWCFFFEKQFCHIGLIWFPVRKMNEVGEKEIARREVPVMDGQGYSFKGRENGQLVVCGTSMLKKPVRATNGNTTLNGNTPIFFPQVCPPWWFINWFDLT